MNGRLHDVSKSEASDVQQPASGAPPIPPVHSDKTPTVLFLDDQGWSSFEQVAVALRRRGVRTVRVTTSPPARFQHLLREPFLAWLADRLFYDERIHLGGPEGEARLRQLLDGGGVCDVIANEPTLLAVGLDTPNGEALTAHSLAFRGTPPATLLDKFKVNVLLEQAGIGTPRQLRTCDVSPAEAVRQFGLPMMLKHPVGASGDRVRTAHSRGEIRAHIDELGGNGAPLFYQEHVIGTVVIYGAVIGAEGVICESGFRVAQAQYENGPAASITLHETPALLEAGRKASAALGPQGFVSFGFLETADGRLLHMDANIRPWGMIAAPLDLGVDFGAAYAADILGTPLPPSAPSRAGAAPLPVFPHQVFVAAETWRARDGLAAASALVRTFARPLGLPYCAYILARSLLIAARGLRADRRVRRRAARAAETADTASVLAQGSGEAIA